MAPHASSDDDVVGGATLLDQVVDVPPESSPGGSSESSPLYGLSRLPVPCTLRTDAFASLVAGDLPPSPQSSRAFVWRPLRRGAGQIRHRRGGDRQTEGALYGEFDA